MLVRKVVIRNIRSYGSQEKTVLELPDGVTLLEGDVGSGKSTILYALEFALFGLGDMKGQYILSEGRTEGSVSVTLEVGGKDYEIGRRLRRKGKDVVQEECYFSSAGFRTRLSPSDLKERVVSVLGFNEPTHPKAESLVYRYAVFTPQEQMKQILVQNPEERLHVIRRVLGAQSYQAASENSTVVERRVKEVAYGLKRASEDLEDKKSEARSVSQLIAELEGAIPGLEADEANSSRLVRTLESELKELRAQHQGLSSTAEKIPLFEKELRKLQKGVEEVEEGLRSLELQLNDEISPTIKEFESLEKPSGSARTLQSTLVRHQKQLTHFEDAKEALIAELADTADLVSKGVCPLCGQKVPKDFAAKSEHVETEIKKVEIEIRKAAESVEELNDKTEYARKYEDDEKLYRRALSDKSKVETEISASRKKLQAQNREIAQVSSELDDAGDKGKEIQALSEKLDIHEKKLDQARALEKRLGVALERARTRLEGANGELSRMAKDIEKKEKEKAESHRLTSYQWWVSSFFRPTVEMIEKETLSHAAARFNDHFQRFFGSLVDDSDMAVRVREDFSPVFEREGFEQDYDALSGGERTSMALAYRFALNAVIREDVSAQPELIILDEPTDGFSRDQVYKMRGLLDELGSRQVILVSHEKELESMADHTFNVTKENGVSRISEVRPGS